MKRFSLCLFLALATFFTLSDPSSKVSAATESGLSIRPAIIELAPALGEVQKSTVTVKNITEFALPVSVATTSLIPIDNELDSSRRAEFDASSWIKLSKNNLVLAPGQEEVVQYEVAVPKQANPGGHYAQIGFRVLSEAKLNSANNSQIIPEINAMIMITVPGKINEYAELNTDKLMNKYLFKNSKAKLSFSIENPGNVHILPSPRVTIFDQAGEIARFELQPQLVLPNTYKTFNVDWQANTGYGRYYARVETAYGSQYIPLSNPASSFYVIPQWWFIGLALFGLGLMLFFVWRWKLLPSAIKALSGKKFTPRIKYSFFSNRPKKQPKFESVEIIDRTLSVDDYLAQAKPSASFHQSTTLPTTDQSTITPATSSKVVATALQKPIDEPISALPITPKVSIAEVHDTSSADSKTVIVQTSASTIIRQEPKQPPSKIDLPPTIVRAQPPQKEVIEIKVTEAGHIPKQSTKPVSPSPSTDLIKPMQKIRPPATRAEKIAKKAAATKRKQSKKKA